jgi:hypothetical protein
VPLEKDLEKSEKSQRKHTLDQSLFTKHHLRHVHEIPTNLPPISCSSNSLLLQIYAMCLLALLTAVHALFSSKLKHSILTTLVLLLFSPVPGYKLSHTSFAEGPFVQLCCRKARRFTVYQQFFRILHRLAFINYRFFPFLRTFSNGSKCFLNSVSKHRLEL